MPQAMNNGRLIDPPWTAGGLGQCDGVVGTHHDPGGDHGYWAVVSEGELVGYCCLGLEARVPGVEEEQDTLDVGYGMRPDLLGKGLGRTFVAAIVDFAVDEFSPQRLRLLILTWNKRSQKVAEALGFQKRGIARSGEGDFLVMMRLTSEPS